MLRVEYPELYPIALQEFQAPPTKARPKRDRAFRSLLEQRAEEAGILAKEQEVRRLLNEDKTGSAARLRAELIAEMRRLAGALAHELGMASSL
jgi:hypothetical protein